MRTIAALALIVGLVACRPETVPTASPGTSSLAPAVATSSATLTGREAACAAIAMVEGGLELFDQPPADDIERSMLALQLATLGGGILDLADQTDDAVAADLRTLGERIQRTSSAMGEGLSDDRLWLDTFTVLRANHGALC